MFDFIQALENAVGGVSRYFLVKYVPFFRHTDIPMSSNDDHLEIQQLAIFIPDAVTHL